MIKISEDELRADHDMFWSYSNEKKYINIIVNTQNYKATKEG